ncbi:alpha-glucan family phosphorylase [Rhabdothermincola salaria]|uniref:alpha-glucan family phosphorylase n=1 Tax=Rhabdothermincola salaria TaxID=2903142 RepID=UPI001E509B78|nr:alpha-glucan family phosphorylase [Rhabdothermincola salaria]MCD9623852.1 alpha-glucan family phosphorylase [Rhabdothermincola salaria]
MKAVQTFTVVSQLPPELEPLRAVAMNLGWADDERAHDLFRRLDREAFELEGRDPAEILATESQEQLDRLAADASFTSLAGAVHEELRRSLDEPRWFQDRGASPLQEVAYFSPEFGIAAALPQYSGGLGVLAGDHLKAANDLGLPLVAIGLFYRHGYFRQQLDVTGWQVERFPRLDPRAMALEAVPDIKVMVELAGVPVYARLWRARVGRIELYLLDTDIDDNDEVNRLTCDRLYGGGVEERIRQEIVLGVGGIRALEALGRRPQVFHMNEGHAGFLALERIRCLMTDHGLSFSEAREASRPSALFTTHTPVPAGIDRFPRELMERYFAGWCRDLGLTVDDLMAIGHEPGTPDGEVFNMAAMGLRMAGRANGVAQLHGDVSRRMFSGLWPEIPVEDVPITAVTNGVHAPTWTSPEMSALYRKAIGPHWPEAEPEQWRAMDDVADRDLWRARADAKERLVGYARHKLRQAALDKGRTPAQVTWTDEALDPNALTIGFARRFATYKRATLLFRDPERLRRLLLDADRPVQFVFAGKAHPADEPGHHLLQQVAEMASEIDIRHRLVFLEDYDISVGRMLVQGCDVWLNTPLRPNEACGTSGMKVVFNGGLNLSILDGWWDEMYTPEVGWAIPSAETAPDVETRNDLESSSVYELLERQVVPLYYRRADNDIPTEWLAKVKRSVVRLGPQVESTRMLREYVERLYEPAAERAGQMMGDGFERARGLVRWTRHLERAWPGVSVPSTTYQELGDGPGRFAVEAQVALGDLEPDDLTVELVHGAIDLDEDMRDPQVVPMAVVGDGDHPGWRRYRAEVTFPRSGTFGYTVRAVPSHPDVDDYAQLGRVAIAQT